MTLFMKSVEESENGRVVEAPKAPQGLEKGSKVEEVDSQHSTAEKEVGETEGFCDDQPQVSGDSVIKLGEEEEE